MRRPAVRGGRRPRAAPGPRRRPCPVAAVPGERRPAAAVAHERRPAAAVAQKARPAAPRSRHRLPVLAGVVAAVVLAGCGASATPPPEPDPTARPTISPAVAATQVQLDGALRARGLVMEATELTVRPGEPPSVAGVPRTAFRAILPDDPEGGLVVVYELPDAGVAASAATDLAAYITSGPGRVQYPPDVRFVLRQVGSTLVFFPWSPGSSPDPRTADVAAAVASVGTEVPIPGG